jgi:hypothetical protein
MKPSAFACAFAFALTYAGGARADEGLWTFDNFPAAKVKAALGVDITPAWLGHVRASVARLSTGCSSSIVSPNGLVLTNAHCVANCVHDLSPPGEDYEAAGFLATTATSEKTCPGMNAEILLQIVDVTPRMNAAGSGLSGEALIKARNAASAVIEQEGCGSDPALHCQVVDLYQGGQFKLYRYRKYSDVRLVFYPGDQAAFFGGDPDNFNFPRYDLDCAFLRLYDRGSAVATVEHLKWNPAPPKEGEAVFVAGNPGATFREQTVAQLETQRDLTLPISVGETAELRGRLIRFREESPQNARMADQTLEGVENTYKVNVGRLATLDDPAFLDAKRKEEAGLKAFAARQYPDFGDPWAMLARAQSAAEALYVPNLQLDRGPQGSELFTYARSLVRAASERQKPSPERLPGYTDGQLPLLEKTVLDARPIEPAREQLILEFWLSKSRELLTADDPDTRLLLGRDSPEELAAKLVSGTHLADPAVRKALWDGGLKAVEASDDPLIQFALRIDPEARRVRSAYEEQVTGPTTRASAAIASLRFARYGDSVYPDGTFTLRLSYGAVEGWAYRGKTITPFTDFAGLYERATGAPPFDLDPRWVAAQGRLDPKTVFDVSTTNDVIGGNSGSPLINAGGEVIGAVFDGNIHSIGGDYGYDAALNRTVAVTAAAITEALVKVYRAEALVRELGLKPSALGPR